MPFTLSRGNWFGLLMFPGYADWPYHSPIRVDEIEPLGQRQFQLTFLNLGYVAGLHGFEKRLRTLQRSERHLVAQVTEVTDHTYVIIGLDLAWLNAYFPHLPQGRYFDPYGQPDGDAFISLAGGCT